MAKNINFFIFYNEHLMLADAQMLESITPIIHKRISIDVGTECIEIHDPSQLSLNLPLLPLRQALIHLPESLLHVAIKSYFVLRWERTHQYCGSCGRHTIIKTPSFERHCIHCDLSFFPRISPCVIVRINKGEELLMARSYHYPKGIYGLVAGFIEAGETAEQAAHREVMEETNIKIKNLQYFSSQPWPFPDALMLAYTAEYDSGTLKIDYGELESGGWFHYQKLPGRPANPNSIASKLLNDFIDKKINPKTCK